MKPKTSAESRQKEFDFTPPRPRPFLANLPARIDTYEEGVARFFHWRTGADYYATIDQIADFILSTKKRKVVDLVCDTATFALRLAGRKTFRGRIHSFDNNVTLLERAKQRAQHLDLEGAIEFTHFNGSEWPFEDGTADLVVSICDLHRHPARRLLGEAFRLLEREGHLILTEMLEPKSARNRIQRTVGSLYMRYVQKKPIGGEGVYYDREEMIRLIFEAGFRQVIIQGLTSPASPHRGVLSLIAATK